jgi:hypothetical protein
MKEIKIEINQKWLCKKDWIMDDDSVAYTKDKIYIVDGVFKKYFNLPSNKFNDHEMFYDKEFLNYFELVNKTYDYINPSHYKGFSKEVIDMMVDVWGKENVATHCEITAFKYRMRLGTKPDQPIERDLEKANWYLNKAKELRNELQK